MKEKIGLLLGAFLFAVATVLLISSMFKLVEVIFYV